MIIEYESRPTLIHGLDPRVKMVWMLCVIIMSIVWTNPVYLVALGLSVVVFGFAAQLPWPKLKGVVSFMLVLAAIICVIQGATYSVKSVTLADPTRILFHIVPGWIPSIGPAAPVRLGGFVYGIGMALKILIVLLVITVFGFTTSPSEIVQVIARIPFIPYQVGFVVSTAWKFVPVVQMQMRTLMDAHRSRGVDFEAGGFTQRVKKTSGIVMPLFANSLSMADTMALAMESRAFGYSKRFTFIRPYKMTLGDWAVLSGSLGFTVVACVLMATSRLGAL
ncbi:MAG: Energy-coupling factor transporter transmembrane protein EcfT [Firmicutes bacterium ADurb.Bin506]|nr:MAG: Energy-coupling factor transporter transmembrane protein EcfT [Firmicutes bacterium ADurb.Bin506]